jgi:hypothetical protein
MNSQDKAKKWVPEYFNSFASASASGCKNCTGFTTSWGYIEKYVLLRGTAAAEYTVCFLP